MAWLSNSTGCMLARTNDIPIYSKKVSEDNKDLFIKGLFGIKDKTILIM